MASFAIKVTQFHGNPSGDGVNTYTGHVNITFIRDDKEVVTYGANITSISGVQRENNTERLKSGSPYKQSIIYINNNQYDKALSYSMSAEQMAIDKVEGYNIKCGNCVDFAAKVLEFSGHEIENYLDDGTLLKAYSELRKSTCPVDGQEPYWDAAGRSKRSVDNFILPVFPSETSNMNRTPLPSGPISFYRNKFVTDSITQPRRGNVPAGGRQDHAWDNVKDFITQNGTSCDNARKYYLTNLNIVSPIVINLDGYGVKSTSIIRDYAKFDIINCGEPCYTAWIKPTSGFLVYDKENKGEVNSLADLFGGELRGEGFAKLRALDENQDGKIDASDSAYKHLKIWVNKGCDGTVHEGELYSLSELGIETLYLEYVSVDEVDENENLIGERSKAIINGKECEMVDLYFKYY